MDGSAGWINVKKTPEVERVGKARTVGESRRRNGFEATRRRRRRRERENAKLWAFIANSTTQSTLVKAQRLPTLCSKELITESERVRNIKLNKRNKKTLLVADKKKEETHNTK